MKKKYKKVCLKVVAMQATEIVRASRIIFVLGDSAGEDVFTE